MASADPGSAIAAVLFDWGGTLTPWHDIDFAAEAHALAAAVPGTDRRTRSGHAEALAAANSVVWARSRDHQRSATIGDIFAEAGLAHDVDLLAEYYEFWESHTYTDPEVGPLFEDLRHRGLKVGVLSNTVWPAAAHTRIFERDGVAELIDGAVYSSELGHAKPSPRAFAAAMSTVGVHEPGRCVYVGDRLFEDIWGAQAVGMRAIHVPHSAIPAEQLGHSTGVPDATIGRLSEITAILEGWS
ncbi:MAG: HAD family hydrolase [Nocardioides sp.]